MSYEKEENKLLKVLALAGDLNGYFSRLSRINTGLRFQ